MNNKKEGFTLIEVVAVVAILSILATLLVPSIGGALSKARKMRAMNNLQQIGMARISADYEGNEGLFYQAKTAAEWAQELARVSNINNPRLYCFDDDYLHPDPLPGRIGHWKNGQWVGNEEFRKIPLSITFIVGISPNAPADTTPIAYSRGLDPESGNWKPASGSDGGIYGAEGGFILFLDGHVEFFHTLTDPHHQLVDFASGESTSDIRRAVNPGTRAINWEGEVWHN